jgi:hypothetical protein
VKSLMKRTLALLAAAGVVVWAQGGTMLGIYRHRCGLIPGGMVPTDDDGDLAYVRNGADPLAGLVADFAAAGLALQRNRTNAYWQVGSNAAGSPLSPSHVDIFSYTLVGAGAGAKYVLDDSRFREEDPRSPQAHCNTAYRPDELFPLSTAYRFYDLMIPMPAKSGSVLARALGDDFMQTIRVRTPHGLVEAPLKDFTPA